MAVCSSDQQGRGRGKKGIVGVQNLDSEQGPGSSEAKRGSLDAEKESEPREGAGTNRVRQTKAPGSVVTAQSGYASAAGHFLLRTITSSQGGSQTPAHGRPGPTWPHKVVAASSGTALGPGQPIGISESFLAKEQGPPEGRGGVGERSGPAWAAVLLFQRLSVKGKRSRTWHMQRAGWGTGEETKAFLDLVKDQSH